MPPPGDRIDLTVWSDPPSTHLNALLFEGIIGLVIF